MGRVTGEFVHVGKAGGSSLSCKIAFAEKLKCHQCPQNKEKDNLSLSSAVSWRVGAHFHMRGLSLQEKHLLAEYVPGLPGMSWSRFLFVVRNPVQRIVSAFQMHYGGKKECADEPCLGDINALLPLDPESTCTTPGARCLAGVADCQTASVGAECSRIKGNHFLYNYEHYALVLFKTIAIHPDWQLFSIRSEHRQDDYRKLDLLWGGSGVVPTDIHVRRTPEFKKQNISLDRLPLLCSILCREIFFYKWTLLLATNLNDEDVRISYSELAAECPEAAAAFPSIRHRFYRSLSTPPPRPAQRERMNDSRTQIISECNLLGL